MKAASYFSLLVAFPLLFFSACPMAKNQEISLTGYLYYDCTEKPLANEQLYVEFQNIDNPPPLSSPMLTDSNGRFELITTIKSFQTPQYSLNIKRLQRVIVISEPNIPNFEYVVNDTLKQQFVLKTEGLFTQDDTLYYSVEGSNQFFMQHGGQNFSEPINLSVASGQFRQNYQSNQQYSYTFLYAIGGSNFKYIPERKTRMFKTCIPAKADTLFLVK